MHPKKEAEYEMRGREGERARDRISEGIRTKPAMTEKQKEKDEEERREKETGGDKIILPRDKSSHGGSSFKEQETLSWERAINLFPHLQRENSVPDPKHSRALSTHPAAGVPDPATPGVARRKLPSEKGFFEPAGRVSSGGGGNLHTRL